MKKLFELNRMKTGASQQPPQAAVSPRRRRLLAGGAGAAGVLLGVQARTALGCTVCQSPSARASGNLSHHPHDNSTCWGGRSPGYWKQRKHFYVWRGLSPPTFRAGAPRNISPCDLETRGTLLSTVFTGAPAYYGVWEVLVWPTNYPTATGVGTNGCNLTGGKSDVFGGKGQLLRHLACAYLNASYDSHYPITTNQVVDMWNAVKGGGSYCPAGAGGNCMSAQDIISYISGMYGT